MAFAILCLARLIHGFTSKSKKHVLSRKALFSNKYLWAAFGIGFVLLNLVLLIPFLQPIFEVLPMTTTQLFTVYGLSLLPFIIIQLVKLVFGNDKTA